MQGTPAPKYKKKSKCYLSVGNLSLGRFNDSHNWLDDNNVTSEIPLHTRSPPSLLVTTPPSPYASKSVDLGVKIPPLELQIWDSLLCFTALLFGWSSKAEGEKWNRSEGDGLLFSPECWGWSCMAPALNYSWNMGPLLTAPQGNPYATLELIKHCSMWVLLDVGERIVPKVLSGETCMWCSQV